MSRKDMYRSDCKRVLEKEYIARDVSIYNTRCKESLLLIKKVSQPLTIDNVAGRVLIADAGISWLQIALEGANVWITVMYDNDDQFIQAYFDITNGNDFSDSENPTFEDMYLDVVLNKKLEIHILDEDELEEALSSQSISREEYVAARSHCEHLVQYLKQHTDDFIHHCNCAYNQLKLLLK